MLMMPRRKSPGSQVTRSMFITPSIEPETVAPLATRPALRDQHRRTLVHWALTGRMQKAAIRCPSKPDAERLRPLFCRPGHRNSRWKRRVPVYEIHKYRAIRAMEIGP